MSNIFQAKVALSSGKKMPILGLGVFENDLCAPACKHAFETGYRHIDSAEYYHNEAEIGKAFKESDLLREDVFVTTKIYDPDHGYESTLAHVDKSLAKFQFSYIDLYLIHSPLSGKQLRLETYRALLVKRNAGQIKDVGVSNYGIHHLEEIAEAGLDIPTVNQLEIHPYCQQRTIAAYCREHGIVVQAYSPLARGKETSTRLLDDPVLCDIAKTHRKSTAQVALRWSIQHGFVPLPKSATPDRIRENADIFDFRLTDDEMNLIDGLDKGREGAVTWNPVDVE